MAGPARRSPPGRVHHLVAGQVGERVGAHAQVIGGHGRARKRHVGGRTATTVLSRETQSCRMASTPVSTESGTRRIKTSAIQTISSDVEEDDRSPAVERPAISASLWAERATAGHRP